MKISIVDELYKNVEKLEYNLGSEINVYLKLESENTLTKEMMQNFKFESNLICVMVSNKNRIIKNKFFETIKPMMHNCNFELANLTSLEHKEFSISKLKIRLSNYS